ncbi:acetaldehyde dehydrogenase [Croceicoccus naphthovorans]|uniref:Acetaldehyde dehydrogenase n=1 Tax=Croceicoccus naphthovorans TaxID=1348774 RepID=A0A0G3XJU9_9SPHN|nr:acetaldehyde dehydrogenase [Croceicoccus naphthovorans]
MTNAPARIVSTDAADEWIERLTEMHGQLMFHQSGGCCDGSAPMCFPRGEFRVGAQDVLLGTLVRDTPVWIGAAQFEYWRHTQITIDVVPGRGAGMSLEAPEGVRFIVRSRVFTDDEIEALNVAGEPPHGGDFVED